MSTSEDQGTTAQQGTPAEQSAPAEQAATTPPAATAQQTTTAQDGTPAAQTAAGQQAATAQQPATAEKGVPAVGFLVMAFTDENAADQALNSMNEAKKQQKFYFEEAAVITQDPNGKVKYHETGDMSTGKGAGIGALVGGVLGILLGPAGVVVGAGAGAAIGGAIASRDTGFRNESLGTIGVALMPGTSAVALITSQDFLKAVQQQVPIEDIRTFVGNLATELSAKLRQKKNVAIGLLLTEAGLAIKEIAADADSVEIVAAVITSDAVVVGGAVVTADGAAYRVVGASAAGVAMEEGVITDQGAVVVDVIAPAAASTTDATPAAPAADATPAAPAADAKPAAPAADTPKS